ncbi:LysR family transcriptional regulator [Pseudohalioglobus lutimaris]|uniref:LysR family transcriptional regulator n=1 Tax=Pseudohalioglobus lutimaris TaxID=1737061 RepID=A0A2N5WX58_9GAMM|nr:LysR substrate-binding domain-containing protein [Pseudohalioglobus lutimaris]PLW66824.1 LysR family transcriptional regulator [Pseudohalioglobus lutimaris]
MDLRKLEIFSSVARCGSFSAAAEQLPMAQPAVSIAIRKLEDELGLTLFDRSGRRIQLTAEGNSLLQRAEAILQQVADLQHSAGSMNQLLQGELRIACPSMLATYFLPDLLSGFLSDYPGLTASVTQAGTREIEAMLLRDEIEVGVTTADASSQDLELLPLVSEQMVVCVARGHRWSKRRYLAVADLHQVPMVVYESGYFIREQLDALCRAEEIQPDLRMQSNFLPLLVRMVKQGLGATVGLRTMAEQEPGLRGIPLSPRVPVRMALAKRRGRSISRANQTFLDWVAAASTAES